MATIKSIGERLSQARLNRGMTQEELANGADIDRSYVSNIENGQANITIAMMLNICTVLEVNPKKLFD